MVSDGSPLSRAAARMAVETRYTPEDREAMQEFNQLKQASEEEQAAGIWNGPADQAFEKYLTQMILIFELLERPEEIAPKDLEPRPCDYCEEPTTHGFGSSHLCPRCRRYLQAVADGEEPKEPDPYHKTPTGPPFWFPKPKNATQRTE